MVKNHYVYILICPIDKVVRYVGKTTRPKDRLRQHCKDIGETTAKKRWIKMLNEKNLKPYIQIVGISDSEAKGRIMEDEMVKKYIDTVYNIHMPAKGAKDIKFYKQHNETI